jgi:hypothetical protein
MSVSFEELPCRAKEIGFGKTRFVGILGFIKNDVESAQTSRSGLRRLSHGGRPQDGPFSGSAL